MACGGCGVAKQSTKSSRLRLEGKVAIVTGSGRGIGRAIAEALAKERASVVVSARTKREIEATAKRVQSRGGTAISLVADVSDQASVERLIKKTEKRLGPVDILVNNAGHPGVFGTLWESDAREWWRTQEVNLLGPMLCSRAVLPSMIERKRGIIVNIGSYIGIRATPGDIAYSVSKAALVRFTDGLAESVSGHGISVFLVSPGMVKTRMAMGIPGVDKMTGFEWHPPEDVASLVVRLACGEGKALSGRFLHVEDDLDELVRESRRIRREDLYTLRLLKLNGPAD